MKTKLHLVLSFSILTTCFYSFAQDGFWRLSSEPVNKIGSHLERLDTKKVHFYTLDREGFQNSLKGLNDQKNKSKIVHFPNAKGEIVPFRIKEAPVFAKELTAKYPEIRSYISELLGEAQEVIR